MSGPVNLYAPSVGTASIAQPLIFNHVPGASDVNYNPGQIVTYPTTNAAYILTSKSTSNGTVTANWTAIATAAGDIDTITTDDATVVTPTSGNVNLAGSGSTTTTGSGSTASVVLTGLTNHNVLLGAGTATITKVAPSATTGVALVSTGAAADPAFGTVVVAGGGTGAVTLTAHGVLLGEGTSAIVATAAGATGTLLAGSTGADPAFTASPSVTGSVTAGTTLTATLGAITATNGNLVLGTSGNKILSTSVGTTTAAGANSFGSVVLTTGSATVSTTSVTTNSLIMIWRQTVGATGAAALGQLSVGTITNATSFVINAWLTADATSLATTDKSVIGWMIIN